MNRRTALRGLLGVASIVVDDPLELVEPFRRTLFPGFGPGIRSPITPITTEEMSRIMAEVFGDGMVQSVVTDSDLLDVFRRPHLADAGRYIDCENPFAGVRLRKYIMPLEGDPPPW